MRRHIPGAFAFVILAVQPAVMRADTPPDPLRVVPADAEWFVKIENPRQIVQAVVGLPLFEELKKLDAVREAYETTNARRFYQLLAYVEKQLGHSYVELIDRLAGGGIVLAAKFSDQEPQVIGAIQAKDKELLSRFVALALDVLDQELARQDIKERPARRSYKDVETLRLNPQVHAAVIDDLVLFGSSAKALHTAIDTLRDGKKNILSQNGIAQARKSLPERPAAWTWLNLAAVRSIPAFKAVFDQVSLDPNALFAVGGLVDVIKRAPYAAAALSQRDQEFAFSLRAPSGREGMRGADFIAPPSGEGAAPLLEPANVLGSLSYYLDLSKFWEHRAEILNKEQLKVLESAEKTAAPFLGGMKIGKLLEQTGPHQRIVVVQQTKPGYKIKPRQSIPAFALVASMRDPQLGKNLESLLRAAALFGSFQADLKMTEEKRGPYTLVGYRFPEEGSGKFGPDYETLQYNFSPCFVTVGKQFIVSSTIELGRELIDLVAKEPEAKPAPASTRVRLYSAGAADVMRTQQDALLTQFILGQALNPKEAREQLRQAIDLVDRLGLLDLDIAYRARDARIDVRVRLGKPSRDR